MTSHAAPQYRLISGAAANVEDEKRFFKSIKSITSNTSSNKPEHIIANLFLRFQVEQKTKSSKLTEAQKQGNAISKIYRDMKMPVNTCISFEYIKNNASQWQAHLEHISDFLLPGKGVWWNETDKGIEFYDTDEYFVDHGILPPFHTKAHHFRSSNFKQEEEYPQNTWKECIDKKISIPIHCLHIDI